jgi:biopolymer transport protein ExbD
MRKRRHRYHRLAATGGATEFSSTSIFITPMLDMSFQILAFFVFTYHPSSLEVRIPFVPAGETAGPNESVQPQAPAATDPKTKLPPSVIVLAYATSKGQLGRLEVEAEGKREAVGPRDATSLNALLSALEERLRSLKDLMPHEEQAVVRVSPGLHWEDTVRVIDATRQHKRPDGKTAELFPKVQLDTLQ